MSGISKKDFALLKKLVALALGSDNAGEREAARAKLDALLAKNRKTWNDLHELMTKGGQTDDHWSTVDEAPADAPTGPPGITGEKAKDHHALELLRHLVETYVDLKPHEAVAVALWTLHTHLYDRFAVSPRLALTSPVRGCGKTTLLALLELFVHRARRMDGVSPAAIYWRIDLEHPTLLVDEADNLGLAASGNLRAVMNSGHRRGGGIERVISGAPKKFSTFTPMAIAAIGTLPLPLMHRSIVIHMERTDRRMPRVPETYDTDARRAVEYVYRKVLAWARTAKLADPDMPKELRNRQADNWRPLLAIADQFPAPWPTMARDAALEFARLHHDEDAGVILLDDIRTIFDRLGADRIASEDLIRALLEHDGEWSWSEWRGMRDDQQPRKLSQGELARLLRPFGIRPRSLRRPGTVGTRKGYHRSQFETAWRRYCQSSGTPAQGNVVNYLRG